MTKEQAIALAQTRWWEKATPRDIVAFQLYEDKLCMDFGDFHKAVEETLERPVWTHEFAYVEHLRAEFEGRAPKATLQDVLNLIPKDKALIVVMAGKTDHA